MPYIFAKPKGKLSLEPQNTSKTISTESRKVQVQLSIASNIMDSLIG